MPGGLLPAILIINLHKQTSTYFDMNPLRQLCCIFASVIITYHAAAQGAKSVGLANAAVVLKDEAASLNNIAGTASLKSPSALAAFDNRFGLNGFNTASLALIAPVKIGVASFDATRFGNNLYNESSFGLGFSHKIQTVDLGLKASYIQHFIQEYGTSGCFVFEFGGIAEIVPKLMVGAHIYNFTKAKVSKETDEKLPVKMRVGLGYQPLEKLLITTELEKQENRDARFKSGIEYRIIKQVFLRTGISTHPIRNTFGFGLLLKAFKVDYALSSYSRLGLQNTISLSYTIRKSNGR